MGPRLFSRGNLWITFKYRSHSRGFNGATTFQPWKFKWMVSPLVTEETCFNGATTFQPWKFLGKFEFWICSNKLQWGHDFSAVEMIKTLIVFGCITMLQWGHDFSAVEMATLAGEPGTVVQLQWGHDFSAVEISDSHQDCHGGLSGFNGATTFQPWKFVNDQRHHYWLECASMGPRLFSRGNVMFSTATPSGV